MKKLCVALLCAISFPAMMRADEISDVRQACRGISDQIKSIQLLAGVSTGASIGGTLANTTAFVSGLMKSAHDKTIAQLEMEIAEIEAMDGYQMLALLGEIGRQHEEELNREREYSQKLGTVRTVGLGVGTATGGVSAITSGIGAKQVGELADQMDRCNRAIDGLKRLQMQKSIAGEPDEMANYIASNCRRLDSLNMETIHKQMVASAVVSGVGAAASLTGAITSGVAVQKEKNGADATGTLEGRESTKTLNTVANVSAGVAAGASVGSIALGAVVLSKLNKDSENARACEEVL